MSAFNPYAPPSAADPDPDPDPSDPDPNYTLAVAGVLKRTFAVWRDNWAAFTALSAVVMAPAFAYDACLLVVPMGEGAATAWGMASMLLHLAAGTLASAVITHAAFTDLRGQPVILAHSLRGGLRHTGRVLAMGLLTFLALLAGFCALVVPALYAMAALSVAIPIVVAESRGAQEAFRRSFALTDGNRWRILAIELLPMLVMVGTTYAVQTALGVVGLGDEDGTIRFVTPAGLANQLLTLPMASLGAVSNAIVYRDLRIGREGADIKELGTVFE